MTARSSTTAKTYQLNEHFWTIQGEGERAGHTAVFLRLQGCPVGCAWCDSKLTWYAGGERMTVEQLCRIVAGYPRSESIVLTGGEPLIFSLDPLLRGLKAAYPDRSLHIETSGYFPFKGEVRPDWVTLSPKAVVGWQVADNVLIGASELKYVVDEQYEPSVTTRHLDQLRHLAPGRGRPPVRLMPEGAPPRAEMVERTLRILAGHPGWRFSPRLQYAYRSIAAIEGMNNSILTADEVRLAAGKRCDLRPRP